MEDPCYLHEQLKQTVTRQHLEKISVEIIRLYKDKNERALAEFGMRIGVTGEHSITRVFASLIQTYHPDKLAKIQKEIESAYSVTEISRLAGIYIFKIESRTQIMHIPEVNESYSYDDSDFGYREYDPHEENASFDDDESGNGDERLFDAERSFTEAVNDHFFGGLDEAVSVTDLKNLDGSPELPEYGIESLKGIEYCIHVTGLDLSGNRITKIELIAGLIYLESLFLSRNRIESIRALAGMKDLRELDISDNAVEDLSPLLTLKHLEYVNIMGNPVRDRSIARELAERGIMVIE